MPFGFANPGRGRIEIAQKPDNFADTGRKPEATRPVCNLTIGLGAL